MIEGSLIPRRFRWCMANPGDVKMHSRVRWISAFVLTLLLSVTADHARADRVVDVATGKPIHDAYVVVRWSGTVAVMVEGVVTCFSVAGARTDSDGTFTLPPLSGDVSPMIVDRRQLIILYKAGYKQLPMTDRNELPLKMDSDGRVGVLRMSYLVRLMQSMICGSEQQQKDVLLPTFKAIYAELQALAPEPTTSEQRSLNSALFLIESLEIGYRQAYDRARERAREVAKRERVEMLKGRPDAKLGMTATQVIDATRWGAPRGRDILNRGFPPGRPELWDERWAYEEGRFLYFSNGHLIGIEENGQLIGGPLTRPKNQ